MTVVGFGGVSVGIVRVVGGSLTGTLAQTTVNINVYACAIAL
jgi:hypothetical protein